MFRPNQHIHFVGIGGVGMAGIAEVLLTLGYTVSGSDLKGGALVDHLRESGALVAIGHRRENVPPVTTVVVVSSAVPEGNPEVVYARENNVPVIPRAEMLAELMRMKYGIAVGGAHGKTTTTTMIARVLSEGDLDPTVIIGGRIQTQRSGARLGAGQYLVAESDESDGSFCLLRPAIAVVTNIDAEHLNHYGSFEKLEEAFFQFMSSVPFYGAVIACDDDPVVRRLAAKLQRRVVSYGLAGQTISAADVIIDSRGSTFTLFIEGKEISRLTLPVPGEHMVRNALAAVAVGRELGVEPEAMAAALESFPGVARRSDVVGRPRNVLVIDDYGHHPAEIRATLSGLRRAYIPEAKRSSSRLVVLFQPHRFSRTNDLREEFADSFGDADEIFVGDIYAAGEQPISGVSGESLAASIKHGQVTYTPDFSRSVEDIALRLKDGDVVVTLGAGNIGQYAHELVEKLQAAG